MRLLVVEDEVRLAAALKRGLQAEGFTVDVAHDGVSGLHKAREGAHDGGYAAIVLDIMLPGLSGIDVCRAIRAESGTPIIMLTAKSDTVDVVLGLESGADDYVVKPFKPKELVARMRARLRQHLAMHHDVARGHLQVRERTILLEPGQRQRSRPRHGAVQVAIAPTQLDRRQVVLGIGQARPGETQEHAALRHPGAEPVAAAAAGLCPIRQNDRRHVTCDQLGDRALADLGAGRQRALDVIELRQQRL